MSERILLVDDDRAQIQVLGRILAGFGELCFATSGEAALAMARASAPDLILLDAHMPGLSGFEVCRFLKAEPALADVPVIFVTSRSETAFEVAGFKVGAADFIVKPVDASLVLARVQTQLRLKRMADELRRIATIDGLTSIANRRSFDDALALEWRRARRTGAALSLMMIDIDHFKLFNDHYGHPAGDACLRSIAQAVARACLRPADLVARYGGEEFVVLLPQTRGPGAMYMAQSVLSAIEGLAIPHDASPTSPRVTVSIGIASYDERSACWAAALVEMRPVADATAPCDAGDLLRAVDQALYAAKHAGRARTRFLDLGEVDLPHVAIPSQRHAGDRPREPGRSESPDNRDRAMVCDAAHP